MRDVEISEGELYHVFNRGTEKRKIFLSKKDYERFLVNLVLFNTEDLTVANISRYDLEGSFESMPEKALVKIHAFVLLPNHFHFILEPLVKDGISRLMHRLEMGYSKYFNKFYSRSGNLFQGAYKIVHVGNDAYFNYLPLYIHLNPLDLLSAEVNWKEKGIRNKKEALRFLREYQWSSLPAYLNIRGYPFVEKDLFSQIYEKSKDWERELTGWLPEEGTEEMCNTECCTNVV
ncbi:MAG: transposase [Candidatus Paceibacterota bacterium]|jgi:REP element-mobilizing transposase RayT